MRERRGGRERKSRARLVVKTDDAKGRLKRTVLISLSLSLLLGV